MFIRIKILLRLLFSKQFFVNASNISRKQKVEDSKIIMSKLSVFTVEEKTFPRACSCRDCIATRWQELSEEIRINSHKSHGEPVNRNIRTEFSVKMGDISIKGKEKTGRSRRRCLVGKIRRYSRYS